MFAFSCADAATFTFRIKAWWLFLSNPSSSETTVFREDNMITFFTKKRNDISHDGNIWMRMNLYHNGSWIFLVLRYKICYWPSNHFPSSVNYWGKQILGLDFQTNPNSVFFLTGHGANSKTLGLQHRGKFSLKFKVSSTRENFYLNSKVSSTGAPKNARKRGKRCQIIDDIFYSKRYYFRIHCWPL